MQVAFCFAGEITQVLDALPWVRCASGNVLDRRHMSIISDKILGPFFGSPHVNISDKGLGPFFGWPYVNYFR